MTPAASIVLEAEQRLSRSRLWQWQRRFFCDQSTAAWQKGTVPHYITSNTFIADAYAKVGFGFLRDCAASIDPSQPIYIIELGAGVGRFGFHFLKRFFDRLASSPLRGLRVTYVLTDLVAANVDYYLAHPQLQGFFDSGQLDCATFDLESDCSLQLRRSGVLLGAGSVRNPLMGIANYVFDGVPVDAFRIVRGQLAESLVTLRTPPPVTDPDDPVLLGRSDLTYTHRKVTLPYYAESSWNQILADYQASAMDCAVLFPCAALACIARLRSLASGRLLLLSADKGLHRREELGQKEPTLALHGSFSTTVNYHALAQWVRALGGQALSGDHWNTSLSIQGFLLGLGDAPETRLAFADHLGSGGPDDLYLIKKALDTRYETLTTEQLLALLRLTRWDGKIFLGCIPVFKQRLAAGGLSAGLRADLGAAIAAAQDSWFPIGEEHELRTALADLQGACRPSAVPPANRGYGHRFAELRLLPPAKGQRPATAGPRTEHDDQRGAGAAARTRVR